MKNMKVENLPKELKSKIKKAQDQYIAAKAKLQAIESTLHENKTKVLANNVLTSKNGERVLTAIADYRLSDEDFKIFLELLFIENKKSGLPVTDVNEAIDWIYRKEVLELEEELLKLQLETIPSKFRNNLIEMHNSYKYKEKVLDLIIRLDCTL